MATVVAMMARKRPTIKLQVLFWPVTDANFETESYNLFAKDRFLTKNLMMDVGQLYN
jgi:acetyl esterase/lipase